MNPNKKILTNPVFILLFLNSILVLLSYSYNSYNGYISGTFTIAKQLILLFSLIFLLFKSVSLKIFRSACLIIPVAFFIFSIFRSSFLSSLYSLATLFVPYFYILSTLSYLIKQFSFRETFGHLLLLFNFVYLYPIVIYFLLGTGFEKTNIYGIEDQGFFFSNHYGWATAIFLTTTPAIIYLFKLNKLLRTIFLGCTILAFYLLIISANRSAMLAVTIALIILVFFPKGIHLLRGSNAVLLIFLISVPFYFLTNLKDQKNSSVNFLIKKNEKQFETKEKAETRFVVANFAFDYFNNNPILWLTGVGLFNHAFIQGVTNLGAYHNSYWEILFGGGVLVFLFFLSVMILRPIYVFNKYIGNFGLIMIPLIIIPFFESNLTGGQFLFFPWFSIMLLMNVRKIV